MAERNGASIYVHDIGIQAKLFGYFYKSIEIARRHIRLPRTLAYVCSEPRFNFEDCDEKRRADAR